ncbi:Exportin-2 [Echinococcus granulosus]|nr:Exportin-2 [Echinococcus granulosus]
MELAHCNELAQTLARTLSPLFGERRRAENVLKSMEHQPGYSVCLLVLLQDPSQPKTIRLSAATTLKNFIKRYWKTEAESDNLIPDADREQLKAQLINAMLTSTGASQHMLSEAIGLIGREDFPARWPSLLPDIIQRITQLGTELDSVQGLLYTAHSLFKRYRHEMRSNELFLEMKLVIGQFAGPLTTLTLNLMNLVVGPNRSTNGSQLVPIMHALLLVCKIFLSLNCQDLPEFFEDNMGQWMGVFHQLLHLDPQITELINSSAATADAIGDTSSAGTLVEQVKSQVCDNITLYATKYASDFTNYLSEFVKDVWEMLISMKNTQDPKYDTLIGNALDFLSSVVSRPQHRALFEVPETLQKLCELIVLPNIQLSTNDEEMFEDSPEEYIRRDLEGSDAHTRRRSACNLVYALCEAFEGPVIDNFARYINHLLTEYANAVSAITTNSNSNSVAGNRSVPMTGWSSKDSALLLVTSLAAKGKTEKFGVTSSSRLVDIPNFFETHVLPELQNPNVDQLPVIKADCLRYAITFRGILPSAAILNLFNLVPNFLTASSVVVHSYAAVLLEKFLLMTIPDRPILTPLINKSDVINPEVLIQRCLEALSRPASCESVYLMRALLRICSCLEDRCLPSMNSLVTALVTRLGQMIKNPSKPQFNHFLFESLCLCVRLTCAADPSSIAHFESALFMIFQEILQQDITELFPYVFQLLAVMLEQYPLGSNVRELCSQKRKMAGLEAEPQPTSLPTPNVAYQALLPRLLVPPLWETQGAVMSLARLMQAYLLHNMEAVLATNKMDAILGVYQRLLTSKTNDVYAFTIISAFLLAFPRTFLEPFLPQIFICIFQRLQTAKTEKFMRCLTAFLAYFVLIFGANDLVRIMDQVQNRIFSKVLAKVILPHAELAISLPVGLINPTFVLTAHSNAGDAHANLATKGADSGYASLSSSSFSHLAREEWRVVSVGLTTLCTQAEAICNPTDAIASAPSTSYHADAWIPLVQAILAGLAAGPARCGQLAADAAVAAATSAATNTSTPVFSDERFTDVAGDSASFTLVFATPKMPNLCPGVVDPRVHFAKSLETLSRRYPSKISAQLRTKLTDGAKSVLEAYFTQSMVRLDLLLPSSLHFGPQQCVCMLAFYTILIRNFCPIFTFRSTFLTSGLFETPELFLFPSLAFSFHFPDSTSA